MRVPNSVVLPVGTHVDACSKEEVEEKKKDIMCKIQAMLEERQVNLAHLITNLEDNEESEFYEDQWTRLKEMENCTLTVRNIVIYISYATILTQKLLACNCPNILGSSNDMLPFLSVMNL